MGEDWSGEDGSVSPRRSRARGAPNFSHRYDDRRRLAEGVGDADRTWAGTGHGLAPGVGVEASSCWSPGGVIFWSKEATELRKLRGVELVKARISTPSLSSSSSSPSSASTHSPSSASIQTSSPLAVVLRLVVLALVMDMVLLPGRLLDELGLPALLEGLELEPLAVLDMRACVDGPRRGRSFADFFNSSRDDCIWGASVYTDSLSSSESGRVE
jgi:hypothetical protein